MFESHVDCAQGITAYQTDYSMAALTVRAPGSPLQPADGGAFNLPMASLDGKPGARAPLLHPLQLTSTLSVIRVVPTLLFKVEYELSGIFHCVLWTDVLSGELRRGQGQAVGHICADGAAAR